MVCMGDVSAVHFCARDAVKFLPNLRMPTTVEGSALFAPFLMTAPDGNESLDGSRPEGRAGSMWRSWGWARNRWTARSGLPPASFTRSGFCRCTSPRALCVHSGRAAGVQFWPPSTDVRDSAARDRRRPGGAFGGRPLVAARLAGPEHSTGPDGFRAVLLASLLLGSPWLTLMRLDPGIARWIGKLSPLRGKSELSHVPSPWGVGIVFPGSSRHDEDEPSVFLDGFLVSRSLPDLSLRRWPAFR